MAGSISDQSCSSAVSAISLRSGPVSGSTLASSNRPPLNQRTASAPKKPPVPILPNSSPSCAVAMSGRLAVALMSLLKSLSGRSLESSANMQKTVRLRKCATARGSWPRSCKRRPSSPNFAATLAVISCGLSPGFSRSEP